MENLVDRPIKLHQELVCLNKVLDKNQNKKKLVNGRGHSWNCIFTKRNPWRNADGQWKYWRHWTGTWFPFNTQNKEETEKSIYIIGRDVLQKLQGWKGHPIVLLWPKRNQKYVEGRKLKPPCSCKSKCYQKISEENRLHIFNQFWKKCDTWDQRRQVIARSVTKKQKLIMKTEGNLETDRRKFSFVYRLIADSISDRVRRTMFLNTLWLGEKFVKVSLEKQFDGGLIAPDQRGKHTPAKAYSG